MVSQEEEQINKSLSELEDLKKQAEAAQSEELPVRRFRAGVDVRPQQQQVLQRRQQAGESLQLISSEKERLLKLRDDVRRSEEQQRAIDEENQSREQAQRILDKGGRVLQNELREKGRVGELLRRAVGGRTIPDTERKEVVTITPIPQDIIGAEKTKITQIPQNVLEAFPQEREIIYRLPQNIIGGDTKFNNPQITIIDEDKPNRIVVVNPKIIETEIKQVEQKKTIFDKLGEFETNVDIRIREGVVRTFALPFSKITKLPLNVSEQAVKKANERSIESFEKIIYNSPPLTFGAGGKAVREFQVGLFTDPIKDIEKNPSRQLILFGIGGAFGRVTKIASSSKIATRGVQAAGIALTTAFGVEVTKEFFSAKTIREKGGIIGVATKDLVIVGSGFRLGERIKSPTEFETFRRVAAKAEEFRIKTNPITEQEILNIKRPSPNAVEFIENAQVARGITRNIPKPLEISEKDLFLSEELRRRATGITNKIPSYTRPSAKIVGRVRELAKIVTGGINEPIARRLRALSNLPDDFTPENRAFVFKNNGIQRLGIELDLRTTDIQKLSLKRLAENSDVTKLRELSLKRINQVELAGQNLRRIGAYEPIKLRPLQTKITDIQKLSLQRLEEGKLRDLSIKQLDTKIETPKAINEGLRNQANRFRSGADIVLFKEGKFERIIESRPRFKQDRPLRTPEQEGLRDLSLKRLQIKEIKPVNFKITDETLFRQSIRKSGGRDPVLNAIKTSGILKPFEQSAKGFKETSRIKIFKAKEPELPKGAEVIKSGNQLLVLEKPEQLIQKTKTKQTLIPQGRFENLNVGKSKFKDIGTSRFKSLGITKSRFDIIAVSLSRSRSADAQLSKSAQLSIFSQRTGQGTRQAQRNRQRFREADLLNEAQKLGQGQLLNEALKFNEKVLTETNLRTKTKTKEKKGGFDFNFLLKDKGLVNNSNKSLKGRDLVIVSDLTGNILNIERRIKRKDLLKEATRDIPVGIRGIPRII